LPDLGWLAGIRSISRGRVPGTEPLRSIGTFIEAHSTPLGAGQGLKSRAASEAAGSAVRSANAAATAAARHDRCLAPNLRCRSPAAMAHPYHGEGRGAREAVFALQGGGRCMAPRPDQLCPFWWPMGPRN